MIEELVKDLPEVYQPIFGRPEFSKKSSRACEDRLVKIKQIYLALEKIIDRPLRVLDLGCAQGYFSLHLAEIGASVQGVDYLDKNVVLCTALANENPNLDVEFITGRIEEVIKSIQPNQFDLVLGLSVFHHLVYEHGAPSIKQMLERLAHLSGALVLEMALQNEPLYWGSSQPSDPRELIDGIGFVRLLERHTTHLANIPRPLYFASNRYWILGGQIGEFHHWTYESQNQAQGIHNHGRRYYFGENCVVKYYRIDEERFQYNKQEYQREVKFLQSPPLSFRAPKLIANHLDLEGAWVAMERVEGENLTDLIENNLAIDSYELILNILEQLVILEENNLYHNDVRTWNVIFDKNKKIPTIIDYGSIANVKSDCTWPENIYLSFFIFVKEVVVCKVSNPIPLRSIAISPFGFPEPYKKWAVNFWAAPTNEWSFRLMHETLKNLPITDKIEVAQPDPMSLWMKAIEDAVQIQKLHTQYLFNKGEAKAQQTQELAMQAEAKAQQAQASSNVHVAQLHAVYASTSWQITAPLLWAVQQLRLLRTHGFKQRGKAAAKKVLRTVVPWVAARPTLRRMATQVAYKLGLAERLKPLVRSFFVYQQPPSPQRSQQQALADLITLTPRAEHFYKQLKQSGEKLLNGRK